MKLLKRGPHDAHHDDHHDSMNMATSNTSNSSYVVLGACVGSAALIALIVIVTILLIRRRRASPSYRRRMAFKQLILPKEPKPVIRYKTQNGPGGGLKNNPSPVQSPEKPLAPDWPRQGSYQSTSSTASTSRKSSLISLGTDTRKSSVVGDRKFSLFEGKRLSAGALSRKISDAFVGGPNGRKISADAIMGQLPSREVWEPSTTSITVNETAMLASFNEGPAKKPQLKIALLYNLEKTALCVTIVNASDLAARTNKHKSSVESALDAYVKLQLLPEKQHKVKTKVVKNTLNPTYDEVFTFYGINYNQLQSTTLHFAVIACDRFSRDEVIGEVICALSSVDLSVSNKQVSLNLDILNPSLKFQKSTNRGDILLSLCYHPSTNKVTALVLKAKNLPKFDITGLADPYVKVYLLFNNEKISKKKTHVMKRTLTPVWNESLVFDLPTTQDDVAGLDDLSMEFLVMDWDRVTRNEVMARVDVGAKAKSLTGRVHWEEVMKNPRKQIAQWHRLRP